MGVCHTVHVDTSESFFGRSDWWITDLDQIFNSSSFSDRPDWWLRDVDRFSTIQLICQLRLRGLKPEELDEIFPPSDTWVRWLQRLLTNDWQPRLHCGASSSEWATFYPQAEASALHELQELLLRAQARLDSALATSSAIAG